MKTIAATSKTIVSKVIGSQKNWVQVGDQLKSFSESDTDGGWYELATTIGGDLKSNNIGADLAIAKYTKEVANDKDGGKDIAIPNVFNVERPTIRQIVDAAVCGQLDKAETKEFVSTLITTAGFEDYSAALYTRHLGRHFAKQDNGSGAKKKAKKLVSEVIIALIPNIEDGGYEAVLNAILEAKDNASNVVELKDAM